MGQVIVRNLEDLVIESHRRLAQARGVSLESQLREVLRESARPAAAELVREARRIRAMSPARSAGRKRIEGWRLIRDDRDNDESHR